MKPCFGYIRVSTQKQGEGVSLEAQKDAIQVFASRQSLEVIKWFEEKQTAAKSGRPIFNAMLRQLKRGVASGLIMHKIDRSARNLKDWAIVSELPDAGIDVYIATESLDFNSRGGRLTADIQAVIAADFIRNLREETIKGLNGRLKQGLYPFRAPIGYLDNGSGQPKTPCPIKSPLIIEMFELYASGQHSLRSLHAEMDRRGLRNSKDRPLSMCGTETIINNPFYTGLIVIKRTGKTFEGMHEPLISPSLFRRVQDIKSGRCGKKVTRHRHLYQGLFRCGLCNGPMSPERQKGRVYYRCHSAGCDTKTVREDALNSSIVKALKNLEIEPEMAEKLEEGWAANLVDTELATKISSLELRVADEVNRQERLTDLLVDGTIDKTAFNTRQQTSKMRIADLRDQLRISPNPAEIETTRREFLELMKNLVSLHILANDAEKRVFIKNTFSNRTVIRKNVELEPSDWLCVGQNNPSVLFGAPYRDTNRIFKMPKELKRLLQLMNGESLEV